MVNVLEPVSITVSYPFTAPGRSLSFSGYSILSTTSYASRMGSVLAAIAASGYDERALSSQCRYISRSSGGFLMVRFHQGQKRSMCGLTVAKLRSDSRKLNRMQLGDDLGPRSQNCSLVCRTVIAQSECFASSCLKRGVGQSTSSHSDPQTGSSSQLGVPTSTTFLFVSDHWW